MTGQPKNLSFLMLLMAALIWAGPTTSPAFAQHHSEDDDDKDEMKHGDHGSKDDRKEMKKKEALHGVHHREEAEKDDMSKKSFKESDDLDIPDVGEMGHARRASVSLHEAADSDAAEVGAVEGGGMVWFRERQEDWVRIEVDGSQTKGWARRDDFRRKAPVVWQSNRHEISYQECLGKKCKAKHADDVHKHTRLLEVDRGGPDNAFLYVKMPNGVYGWVPVAYMMEWKHKFK